MKRDANKPKTVREVFECPNCGADVAVGARVCRECGSDNSTGWQSSEEIDYQGTELPEGYAVDPEHPGHVVAKKRSLWTLFVVLVLVCAFAAWAIVR